MKRHQKRRQCDGKIRFKTLVGAQIHKRKHHLPFLRSYKCCFCGGWHNGNTPVSRHDNIQRVIDEVCA